MLYASIKDSERANQVAKKEAHRNSNLQLLNTSTARYLKQQEKLK